jgi:hypothetical protein
LYRLPESDTALLIEVFVITEQREAAVDCVVNELLIILVSLIKGLIGVGIPVVLIVLFQPLPASLYLAYIFFANDAPCLVLTLGTVQPPVIFNGGIIPNRFSADGAVGAVILRISVTGHLIKGIADGVITYHLTALQIFSTAGSSFHSFGAAMRRMHLCFSSLKRGHMPQFSASEQVWRNADMALKISFGVVI